MIGTAIGQPAVLERVEHADVGEQRRRARDARSSRPRDGDSAPVVRIERQRRERRHDRARELRPEQRAKRSDVARRRARRRRWPAPSRRWRRGPGACRRASGAGGYRAGRGSVRKRLLDSRPPPRHRQPALGRRHVRVTLGARARRARRRAGRARQRVHDRAARRDRDRAARSGGRAAADPGAGRRRDDLRGRRRRAGGRRGRDRPRSASSRAAPAATSGARSSCPRRSRPPPRTSANAPARAVDAGRVRYRAADGGEGVRHFINVASFGFSSAVARRANASSKRLRRQDRVPGRDAARAVRPRQPRRLAVDRRAGAPALPRDAGRGRQRPFLRRRHEDLPGRAPRRRRARSRRGRRSDARPGGREHRPAVRRGRTSSWSRSTHARITRLHAEPVEPDADIAVELDGETPGHLPATFEIVPGALAPPRLSAAATASRSRASAGCGAVPSNMSETLYFSHSPLAAAGRRAREERLALRLGHRLRPVGGVERLREIAHRLAAGDHDRRRRAHRVAQAIGRRDRASASGALWKNTPEPSGFIASTAMPLFVGDRQHPLLEAVVVRVHHVERHLHGVEREPCAAAVSSILQVNRRALVAGEADEADLARLLAPPTSASMAPSGAEHALRIGIADHLVDLHQIDDVGAAGRAGSDRSAPAAALRVRPSIFVIRKTRLR